jgi:hypothetical protein
MHDNLRWEKVGDKTILWDGGHGIGILECCRRQGRFYFRFFNPMRESLEVISSKWIHAQTVVFNIIKEGRIPVVDYLVTVTGNIQVQAKVKLSSTRPSAVTEVVCDKVDRLKTNWEISVPGKPPYLLPSKFRGAVRIGRATHVEEVGKS